MLAEDQIKEKTWWFQTLFTQISKDDIEFHKSTLVCYVCHSKVPQTGRLKQQKSVFSQFWRLDAQDYSAGGVGFLPSWAVDSPLLSASSYGLSSVCICVLISSLYKDTSHIGSGPHPNDLISP